MEKDRNQSIIKRGMCLFLVIALGGFALAAGATYVVDPFFHYHEPLDHFPYVIDDKINQNPGMAANMTYDSFITGSSMTVGFHTEDFASVGAKTIKLSYDGAYPADIKSIMEVVFDDTTAARQKNPVKAAFIGLDLLVFTADPAEHKFPLTDYLYDDNPLNDAEYLLNKTVLADYIIKPLIEGEGTDLSDAYRMDWLTEEMFGEEYVLSGYEPSPKKEIEADREALVDATVRNLEENILPFVEEQKDTTFYFFFPAYSILFWNNVLNEQMLEARLYQTQILGEMLLQYPNVKVFYFSDCEEIITDLHHYTDYTHHSEEISRFEAQCMTTGEHEVQPGGMKAQTDHMREIVKAYNFDRFSREK